MAITLLGVAAPPSATALVFTETAVLAESLLPLRVGLAGTESAGLSAASGLFPRP